MDYALGMVEFRNISMGITIADKMVKASQVQIIKSFITFPGRYVVLLRGKLGAINASIEKSLDYEELINDFFILGNPHENIFKALDNNNGAYRKEALGLIETSNIPSIIEAADIISKTAQCDIVKIRLTKELGGQGLVLFSGEIAAVEASTKTAVKYISEKNQLISHSVIPNPDKNIWQTLDSISMSSNIN